jgi:hypothetical protein
MLAYSFVRRSSSSAPSNTAMETDAKKRRGSSPSRSAAQEDT